MRDPKRIDKFCDDLKELWYQVPDWRFGQLLCNVLGEIQANQKRDIFFIEDDQMMASLKDIFSTKYKYY